MQNSDSRDDEKARWADDRCMAIGSPEAIARARRYVLDQLEGQRCVECARICRLTGWDAARIRRFVRDIQDALWTHQGKRGPGRPSNNS